MTTLRATTDIAAREAMARRTETLFRESGALREGHFSLKSGRHADRYLEKFLVLQHPAAVTELCSAIAAQARGADGSSLVDVVAGPTTGGVILAFEVARQLGVRAIFAEEVTGPDGARRREFRRGFRLDAAERVLLVDDILTTGGSLVAMLPAVEASGAAIAGAVVIIDRSGGLAQLVSPGSGRPYRLTSLWTLDLPTYPAGSDECAGCRSGAPLDVPGSTGTTPAAEREATAGR